MSEIAACTLIQEAPDRKTERYMMMFKDYPDVVTVEHLQKMLGVGRKIAYLLVKENKIEKTAMTMVGGSGLSVWGAVTRSRSSALWSTCWTRLDLQEGCSPKNPLRHPCKAALFILN